MVKQTIIYVKCCADLFRLFHCIFYCVCLISVCCTIKLYTEAVQTCHGKSKPTMRQTYNLHGRRYIRPTAYAHTTVYAELKILLQLACLVISHTAYEAGTKASQLSHNLMARTSSLKIRRFNTYSQLQRTQ